MKLSEHFEFAEFACKCCGQVKVNRNLVLLLETIRAEFNQPITIISGYRCNKHNKAVGGAKKQPTFIR